MYWHTTDSASVTLERKGPEDRNYYPAGISSGGSITQLQPDTTYQFRLRAEIAGVVTYTAFSGQTLADEAAPGDRTLPAPAFSANAYPYPGPSQVTPVGSRLPDPGGQYWNVPPYMYQIRWNGRPECMGGPTWGIYSPEQSAPASPSGAGGGDLWFGNNGGWTYSVRAYAQSPLGDHTSNWSVPYGGTTSGSTTGAIGAPLVTRTSDGGISLSWSGSTSGFYGVVGGNHNGQTVFSMFPSFITSTYFSPATLGSGRWQFGVMAQGGGGWSTPTMSAAMEVRDPLPVTSVSANLGDARDQIRLSWSNTRDETGYRIERRKVYPTTEAWLAAGQTGADVTTSIQTLPSDFAGEKYEFRVIAFDERKDAAASPSAVASGIALQSVTFGGAGFQTISRDNGTGVYGGPQWFDRDMSGTVTPAAGITKYSNGTIDSPLPGIGFDGWIYPLSYLRSTPTLQSVMSASPSLFYGGSTGGVWSIRANAGEFALLAGTGIQSQGDYLSIQLLAEIPGVISSTDLDITWQMTTDGGLTWFEVGTSNNHLYVTGGDADAAFESVVHIGTEAAAGLNTQVDTIVDRIKTEFADRSVKRVGSNTAMRYWGPYSKSHPVTTATGLLLHGDGRCGAWVDLFLAVTHAQGAAVWSEGEHAIEELSYVNLYPKHGAPDGLAGGVFQANVIVIDPAKPAQGGVPLQAAFSEHAVVMHRDANGVLRFFDPSYGGDWFDDPWGWENSGSFLGSGSVYKYTDGTEHVFYYQYADPKDLDTWWATAPWPFEQ